MFRLPFWRMLFGFAGAFFLFACSESPLLEKGLDGADGSSCEVRSGTEGHAYDIYCADTLVGYLDNGADGASGKDGADGADCKVISGVEGHAFGVYCADTLAGYLDNGADGASCEVRVGTEGHAYDVYCSDTLAGYLDNGANGANGDSCSVEDVLQSDDEHYPGLKVTCGESVGYLKDGAKGEDGEDGEDGEPGVAGSSGSQGEKGADGADGASCWIGSSSGSYYEIWCGTSSSSSKSAEIPKALCGSVAYDPAADFCDLLNPYTILPLCDGKSYNTATQYCEVDVIVDFSLCGEASYNPATHYCALNGNGDSIGVNALFLDTRDDKTYRTVLMPDGKVWLAENLNYAPLSGNSWCYNSSDDYCTTYGRLYDWSTAMGISADYNTSLYSGSDANHRGICPEGWHLPSDGEWTALATAISTDVGTKLKSKSVWSNTNGTDDYGFSALPGGDRLDDEHFNDAGYSGYWWSSTEYDASDAYDRNLDNDDADLDAYNDNKSFGFSVRCLRD